MKKLILTMVAITVVVASYAHQNPFERNRIQNTSRAKMMANYKLPNILLSNINVPTLTKNSYWNDFSSSWETQSALVSTYSNNRLVSELQVSYNQTDTFGMYVYTYDNNNRYSMVEYKNYDPSTHTFTDNGRQTFSYANFGSYTALVEVYDMGTNTWTPSMRVVALFDNHFNNVKYSYETYNSGMWQISFAYSTQISYYDNSGKLLETVDSNYNQSSLLMEASYKMSRTYNSAGQVQSILYYDFDNNVAVLNEVDSVKYDNNGVPTSLTMYDPILMTPMYMLHDINWAGGFNATIDLFKNQPISYLESEFANIAWVLVARYTTQFPDNFGSRVELNEEYVNNVYLPAYRRSNINDSHINIIEESEEEYDATILNWIPTYGNKYSYQYDISGNMTEKISMQFQSMDTSYVNNQRLEFSNFINITSGVNTTKTLETKLYPNPTSNGSVSIKLNLEKTSPISIDVIDLNGRVISSQNENFVQGLNTVQLDGLTQGMYFVVISSDYGVSRTKLMVK